MNAVLDTEFSRGWKKITDFIPKPKAIICFSAHWETRGSFITGMERPRTIHDFMGFPEELFQVKYHAYGNPGIAHQVQNIIKKTSVQIDKVWGLDHGTWSVLKHMYPEPEMPVLQFSLHHGMKPSYHYELAKELKPLRDEGVLFVGSGNIIHNLGLAVWNHPHDEEYGHRWAIQANDKLKKLIQDNELEQLMDYQSLGEEVRFAIPTPEHFIPLFYILGLKEPEERVEFFNDKLVMGSISMTSMLIK
jgi:4,5-DOPA dioxygenase extradiol